MATGALPWETKAAGVTAPARDTNIARRLARTVMLPLVPDSERALDVAIHALEEDLGEFMLEMGMWMASPAELRERARDGLPVPDESDKEYCAGVKLDTALR